MQDLLEEAMSADVSGNFQDLFIALLMRPAEYDAYCINEAVSGIGTNAAMLTEVMCTLQPDEIRNLEKEYKNSKQGLILNIKCQ